MDGQILVAQRVAIAVEEVTKLEEIGPLTLKGLSQPVVAFNTTKRGWPRTAAGVKYSPSQV
jgi:class 3 adenylate cyclase